MSGNGRSDCCEYREAKRKLARQKLRMKMEASKDMKKKRDDECDDEDEELEMEKERKCEEKRAQRVEALSKLLSLGDEMMRRIKPSIEERDKYSMSYRHIRCFLEPAEIERMEFEERMRTIHKCKPCESMKNQHKYEMPPEKKRKKKKRKKKGKEKEKENSRNEVDDEQEEKEVGNERSSTMENEGEAEPEPEQEMEEPKKDEEKPKDKTKKPTRKNEFWCREVKKKEKPKRDERQFEIDCKDSICSFDSELNLSGLALTREDLKKIAETRRSKMASTSKDTT